MHRAGKTRIVSPHQHFALVRQFLFGQSDIFRNQLFEIVFETEKIMSSRRNDIRFLYDTAPVQQVLMAEQPSRRFRDSGSEPFVHVRFYKIVLSLDFAQKLHAFMDAMDRLDSLGKVV
jgi:hypothetical protein